VYARFAEDYMAMPVIKGVKTENERFAGALETYTIEALMQDKKALQAGTSHFLGQNFAKAFDVTFLNENNKDEHVWATSWGVSTRLVGALIMTHSDDQGLVLPPKLAPVHVAIVPIPKPGPEIDEVAHKIREQLEAKNLSVQYDTDLKKRPGFKFAEHELKGVPVRLAIGKRDLEKRQIEVARRDTGEKVSVPLDGVVEFVEKLLDDIQANLFNRALEFRAANTHEAKSLGEFKELMESNSGFVKAHWDGTTETELRIKDETKATIRCVVKDENEEAGICIYSGRPSKRKVLFAKAY